MRRRDFLGGAAASILGVALSRGSRAAAAERRGPRILLRSSWQVVNIGDVAHTPGVLALIEKHVPQAEVVLWASGDLSPAVAAMEHRRFPKLKIVKGTIDADGKASNAELADAVKWADLLLHGSGPSMVGHKDVAAFEKSTGKPFGVYGITYGGFGTAERELLGRAAFAYFRDSVSLARAKDDGIRSPVMEFAPDGAFACDVRDDAAAKAFMAKHGLEEGKFLCCIPRLRWTPYWTIRNKAIDAAGEKRHARNEQMKERDHAPLRDAIASIVRETPMRVLLCPEDMSQMAVGKEMLLDKLPDDVRARVAWRESFWLTDEAVSTYARSAGLFGLEMHSPILCVGQGVAAIVGRFAEQTSKGAMWRDVGLGEWLFDFDVDAERGAYAAAVLAMAKDPAAAKAKAAKAREFVQKRQAETMAVVRREAGRARRA
jgi:polysaccharide pyruvyl transferase WcaK-like protein